MTESLEHRRALILDHETRLANLIARDIITRPQLSFWMILIPVFFVYFFYGLNRYKRGRREFVTHFLFSRRLILDRACEQMKTGEKPDVEELIQRERVPEIAVDAYRNWAKVLGEAYIELLGSEGSTYEELVRAKFREKNSFMFAINRINTAEKQFYKSLRKHLNSSLSDAGDVVGKMETSLQHLRRQEADFIYNGQS